MMNNKPDLYGINDKNFPDVDKLKVGDVVDLVVKVKVVSKTERVKSTDPMMAGYGGGSGCSIGVEVNSIALAGNKRVKELSVGDFNNVKSEAIRNNT